MQEALLVGLVVALVWFVEKMLGTPMANRPLIISPLVGLVLGDLQSGIIIGASLELVFMGAIQVGAAVPPDVLIGSALGTAFAILSGQGSEIALALALPIAILAQSLKVIIFIVRSWFMDFAMKLAEDANIKGMFALNIGGLLLHCLMYFTVAFIAVLFGASAVEGFVQAIPTNLMNGLEVAGKLLPAVGFALLLQPMMNGKNILYFILGFILIAYLELPILAVTLFGVILAFIIVFEVGQTPTTVQHDELEDLFDE
ncbi:PTS sugar transporter subunit IIC [Erysipelothrix rhusiopathiae]|uniref:PTS mannose/fructose/sorbose/N-acetylgalactosamine transporter subunit IIC n=1 Tax=Erysipelothrix rhusiopathiae TaxID=1648 RepID=UPI000F431CAA|nr:PTS sugar transporter subunit IIC [Erysipelothrix rhusiopathiae]AYV35061.1 PTS sugar transporter subunit IIC [Erysipelothrix rhusiopathiae]MDE8081937.1 PTS sugar transporter subunit IIC [Erysipelothrix rhusiopathiae]MDE8314851.1 PTS sugar transporter subunit IIC [Erysipelothrix rhusiopathiae]MDE8329848.1 PTS sugar transporter subunit IIC [Erysipelothrix rhusiopathiae]MDE8332787.1 PTS sugar transporter subunit IIC [Erysipelothrix rhusiopathiae]